MRRRYLLRLLLALPGVGILLKPVLARADWNAAAFGAGTEAEALAAFFGNEAIQPSDTVTVEVHDLVENGAIVPVMVETSLPEAESITVLAEKNPNPFIAHFELGPGCRARIATRIKVGEPSDIVAVVRSRGALYSARQFVEVVEGGCG